MQRVVLETVDPSTIRAVGTAHRHFQCSGLILYNAGTQTLAFDCESVRVAVDVASIDYLAFDVPSQQGTNRPTGDT